MKDGKASVDSLLRHGTFLTMDEERRIFVDGSIAIDDGKIEAIGTDREIEAKFSSLNVRDLNGAVVHPGLVDAHVHTGMDLIRGLVPESSANWTNVETPFLRSRTSEDDYLSTLICCMEMVSNGSTIYSDTGSSYDLDATVDGRGSKGALHLYNKFSIIINSSWECFI